MTQFLVLMNGEADDYPLIVPAKCDTNLTQCAGARKVRLSKMTGIRPTRTRAKAGSAASPKRSSLASW
jgi:hypothetical protein